MAASTVDKLFDELGKMTVLELVDLKIDAMEPGGLKNAGPAALDEIFAEVGGSDAKRLEAAGKALAYLRSGGDAKAMIDAARRLVFLKHPDLVGVVEALADHATLADTLEACGVEPSRRSDFATASGSLIESEMVRDRPR